MTAAPPPPPAELPARVWSALQAFVDAQDRRAELREALGLGRGTGRVTVLLALTRGPLTLRGIAEANGVDAPYATVIVDKLESRGLVQRTAHPDDNRRKLVVLTAAGRDAAALAGRILAEPPAALTSLPPGDLACLGEILTRLSPPDPVPPDPVPPDPVPPGPPGSTGASGPNDPAGPPRPGGPASPPPAAATS